MQGMQQQEKWKMLAGAEFHLPDLHHSREPKPLGGRGALGEVVTVQRLVPGRGRVGCWVFSGQHFSLDQAALCLLSSRDWAKVSNVKAVHTQPQASSQKG